MSSGSLSPKAKDDFSFKTAERLKSRKLIGAIFRSGQSVGAFPLRAVFLPLLLTDAPFPVQISISVPKKKFKSAVDRNRVRRQIHADVADNLAYKILSLMILIPAVFVLAWLFPPTFNPQPWSILAGVLAIGLAFVVRFMIEWSLAMCALWTNRVNALNQTYEVILVFLSGFFAPLAVMPAAIQVLASFLPFRWLIAFPIELTLGRLTPQAALLGFACQLGWLLVAYTALTLVWRAGVKQYSAVGS